MHDQFFPKITVVTPNYNQGLFLEQTILSVLNQNYPNLEYIIMDAGSTDGSVDIIKKYQDRLSYWESKKDNGMYDALNQGFSHSTGEIMCWINSDDVLWEGSLSHVAKLFSNNIKLQWLQGIPSVIDEGGVVIQQRPHVFSKFFFYLKKHEDSFSFIQQESTFWSRRLWEKAGGKLDLNYSLAADFDLWMRFFNFETLYCTSRQLAAFRKRANQQSSNIDLYRKEVNDSISKNKPFLPLMDKAKLFSAAFFQRYHILSTNFSRKYISAVIGKPKYV
jgi:glycosyltransferase involved in cell wall biosynthesis